MDLENMTVGERIEEFAKRKNMSIRKLALSAGIPYTTLYSVVKRKSDRVDSEKLAKIANALGIDHTILIFGKTREKMIREMDEESERIESEKIGRLLSAFAIEHPMFINALKSVGVSIRLEGKNMYADFEEESLRITVADLESLLSYVYDNFIMCINHGLGLNIIGKLGDRSPSVADIE